MQPGSPARLGSTLTVAGCNFALYSGVANRVELCLFDNDGQETARHALPDCDDGVWHGFLPACRAGQRYGYRVHGAYAPDSGLRCNAQKLLIDPYARSLAGEFRWSPAVFDFETDDGGIRANRLDSAPFVPTSVVTPDLPAATGGPRLPWTELVIYEANVRGYTMRHPDVPASDRGKFSGMKNGDVIAYLKSLGVTAIELMPVHEFLDEQFLVKRGLRNYWGYNSINFFAPAGRYAGTDPRAEFIEMVNAIHDAGLEVILDVVYNHTGESDRLGPTLSLRGIDNLAYYQVEPSDPGTYINDTGCGNTINGDHPIVRRMIVDSLSYWSKSMGVDGFRFDLAPVLGRHAHGFNKAHPLLQAITDAPALKDAKLIAEPWDPGPGGYQLGQFPPGWAEWNDQYRDAVRRFWRGDENMTGEFAGRIHGSADLFDTDGRAPSASVNFVTAHDGFTLADVVSYEHRHNEANGEHNRDGHAHNYSDNYGVEGETGDAAILELRRRQRLNMLATILLSHGTPMLLAGDEFGNSQGGNNNAYAQDNETGWLDWSGLESDRAFVDSVRRLIDLRRGNPLFRPGTYPHGHSTGPLGWRDIEWYGPDGKHLDDAAWHETKALTMLLSDMDGNAVAVLFNASRQAVEFTMPASTVPVAWRSVFCSAGDPLAELGGHWPVAGSSIACLSLD
jgi:glycogen operon protein